MSKSEHLVVTDAQPPVKTCAEKLAVSKLGMTVDLCVAYYLLTLVSMILTLMQGHSGSAEANKKICDELSRQLSKQ